MSSKDVKIYRYVDFTKKYAVPPNEFEMTSAPVGLNYKTELTRSLVPRRTFVQGELQLVEWFAEYDQPTDVYGDLILRVEITYNRDPAGFALDRTTVRTWICEDESDAEPNKATYKKYDPTERDKEGTVRRGNIVAQIKTIIAGHLVFAAADPTDYAQAQAQLDIGRAFYEARDTVADMFVKLSKQDVFNNIADPVASPDSWLDEVLRIGHDGQNPVTHPLGVTARQALLAEMNIWGL